eukprot:gene3633-6212_t
MDEYPVYEDDEDAIVVDNPRNSKAPTNLPKTEISSAPNQEKVSVERMSFIRNKVRSSDADQVDLPQMIPCAAECGFYGAPHMMNLCSQCYQAVVRKAKSVRDRDAIKDLLKLSGFETLPDFKRDMIFRKLYPKAVQSTRQETIPGVRIWQTTIHPLSQFDQVPQRGNSACTFIAGVAAVRFVLREQIPDSEIWADSIIRGVNAFHTATDDHAIPVGNADIIEALPFIFPTLGVTQSHGMVDVATTIVTLLKPDDITDTNFRAIMGSAGYFHFGKQGLIRCLMDVLEGHSQPQSEEASKSKTIREHPDEEQSIPVQSECALVVIRPPETYCVLKTAENRVYWRDSHRRKQTDFDSTASLLFGTCSFSKRIDAFRHWLESDGIFTVPLKGLPLTMNQHGYTGSHLEHYSDSGRAPRQWDGNTIVTYFALDTRTELQSR